MTGREDKKDNDLFFVCSLIDYISRKTTNRRIDVVNKLGKERIKKIYDLADIYHSDNIERVAEDFIAEADISNGNFDNVSEARYAVPTYWEIGKVYKRLILGISKETDIDVINALFKAYSSFISDKIDDYNSSFYYEAPANILNAYLTGIIE